MAHLLSFFLPFSLSSLSTPLGEVKPRPEPNSRPYLRGSGRAYRPRESHKAASLVFSLDELRRVKGSRCGHSGVSRAVKMKQWRWKENKDFCGTTPSEHLTPENVFGTRETCSVNFTVFAV